MRVIVTGGGGLIGSRLVAALRSRGDEVTVLSRSGTGGATAWNPLEEPAPAAALDGRDAVIHLAGEPIAQRWSPRVREALATSRTTGTAHLLRGLEAVGQRPGVLVSASAVGYYGNRGDERLTEDSTPGAG
jgi:NAD dependent epimerase/dehydratase family enzyme